MEFTIDITSGDTTNGVMPMRAHRQRHVVELMHQVTDSKRSLPRIELSDIEDDNGENYSLYSGAGTGYVLKGNDFYFLINNGDRIRVVADEDADLFETNTFGKPVYPKSLPQPKESNFSSSMPDISSRNRNR